MNKLSTISILNLVFFLSSISMVECSGSHDHDHDIVFSKLPTQLKSSISDMTATYVEDLKGDGVEAIIITGGCSGGNVEVKADNSTNYYCAEVTDDVHIFYPSTENVVTVSVVLQRFKQNCSTQTHHSY